MFRPHRLTQHAPVSCFRKHLYPIRRFHLIGLCSSAAGAALDLMAWGLLLALAIADLRDRRLPLALTRALIGLGLIGATWRGGPEALAWAALSAVLAALPFMTLRHLLPDGPAWRLGGGDIRLAAGLGGWLGLMGAWSALAMGCALSAALGLALRGPARGRIPFGTLCALGVVLVRWH